MSDKNKDSGDGGGIRDRRLGADVFFIRVQATIRADGAPSAQALVLQIDVSRDVRHCRRATIARPAAKQVLSGDARKPRFLYG